MMGQPHEQPAERGVVIAKDDPRDFRALGFDKLSKEERAEMARRGVEARRMNREARKLAEMQAYVEAHREMAARLLGTKMVLLDGLLEEMTDPSDGSLNTRLLDKDRMKLLLGLVDQIEKRGFPTVTKTETSVTVDVKAVIAKLNARIGADEE